MSTAHRFSYRPQGFQMSPYLQELVVFTGQNCVFEDGSEQLKLLAGVEVTAKQIERLTHSYGEQLGKEEAQQESNIVHNKALHYGMVDGGMVFTREEGWKEMKLGRIFPAKAHMSQSEKRNFIKDSSYVAHLGGYQAFLEKLEKRTDVLEQTVWIADGAKWIWNWVESSYPDSVQILDYFHCSEKLHAFAHEAFQDKADRKAWTDKQQALLLASKGSEVIQQIAQISCKAKAKSIQSSLLTYYKNNLERMDYQSYRQQGLLIGSGPMEAAHRHVVQCRLKLSGQRWTIRGAQQVVNLRVANKSGCWKKVVNLINLN